MQITPEQKLKKAMGALILEQAYFASLALRMPMKPDPTCDTMWTDGTQFGYNPDYIDNLSMDETKAVICHEVFHPALGHHVRRGDRDPFIWNESCDYAINPLVLEAGMVLPKGALINPDFIGKSAEEIYSVLYQKKQEQEQDENQKQEDEDQKNEQPGDNPSNGDGKGKDPGGCGEIRDLPGKDGKESTEAEKNQAEQDWKIAATQAATQAEAVGQLPEHIKRLIKELNEPKINWKEALHRFVEQVARNDYSFKRPNTRFAGRGVILPSLYNQELPPIVVAIDTSGSVTEEQLTQFASEVDDILGNYPTTVKTVYCDTQVQGSEEFTQENRPVTLNAQGGGGTKFSPVFTWANELPDTPVCVIYLTDMECHDFGPEPGYPVLWVQTPSRNPVAPPFGELIKMRN